MLQSDHNSSALYNHSPTSNSSRIAPLHENIQPEEQEQLWNQLLSALSRDIPQQFFQAFFNQLHCTLWTNHSLTLTTQDDKVKQHIENRYLVLMQQHLYELTHKKISIVIESLKECQNNKQTGTSIPERTNKNHILQTDAKKKSETTFNNINLNPKYTFERFIQGPSNQHAYSVALEIAQTLGEAYNPFYLYGNVGLGKTHLLMGIANYIKQHHPWIQVKYVSAEVFQNDIAYAVQNNLLYNFKSVYRNLDVLLFDDIQLVSSRAEFTQEEIFHLFNFLYQNNKKIIIASDRPAQQLNTLKDRLISRFQSGLMLDIKAPSYQTRVDILTFKAQEIGLDLSPDVVDYLIIHITDQIRHIEAALIKLQFIQKFQTTPIDIPLVQEQLQDILLYAKQSKQGMDYILEQVSRTFGVPIDTIKGRSRTTDVTIARNTCMYIAKNFLPNLTLQHISQYMGRKDHSTVIHAEKKMKDLLIRNEKIRKKVESIIHSVKQNSQNS